jgi:hypothetical protein
MRVLGLYIKCGRLSSFQIFLSSKDWETGVRSVLCLEENVQEIFVVIQFRNCCLVSSRLHVR